MARGYIASNTSVHFIGYHFVWCPKYRRALLVGKVKDMLKELVCAKADELECKVIALEIMPDHVHLFIQGNPRQSPNLIVGQIKGFTSRLLRERFRMLRSRLPTLWTRSYFVSTHGHISDALIKKYIEEQKGI